MAFVNSFKPKTSSNNSSSTNSKVSASGDSTYGSQDKSNTPNGADIRNLLQELKADAAARSRSNIRAQEEAASSAQNRSRGDVLFLDSIVNARSQRDAAYKEKASETDNKNVMDRAKFDAETRSRSDNDARQFQSNESSRNRMFEREESDKSRAYDMQKSYSDRLQQENLSNNSNRTQLSDRAMQSTSDIERARLGAEAQVRSSIFSNRSSYGGYW